MNSSTTTITHTKAKQAIRTLRVVSIIEGLSYIVLLFISMPLKYYWLMPLPVKYNGWVHGVLFVVFAIALLYVWVVCKWSVKQVLVAGIASLIPFGAFWLDKRLKQAEVHA